MNVSFFVNLGSLTFLQGDPDLLDTDPLANHALKYKLSTKQTQQTLISSSNTLFYIVED